MGFELQRHSGKQPAPATWRPFSAGWCAAFCPVSDGAMTLEKLQALTDPKLQLAPDWQISAPPETPESRAA